MVDIIKSSEIWHRGDFPLLCEWRRLYRAVEVGVDQGLFAECFLSRCWNCEIYLAIDTWGEGYAEMPWNRDLDKQSARDRIHQFPHARIVQGDSIQIAESLLAMTASKRYQAPYDFVYIDASHVKEDVACDLRAWWPVISERGILAGHDWDMRSGDHPGVREAVMEFAESVGQNVYYTSDDPSSFYMYKNGMPGTDWVRVKD